MCRWFTTTLFLIFIVTLSAAAFSQTAVLRGTVTDNETGERLLGANIVLTSAISGLQSLGTSSNENGEFEIRGISPGSYTITISYVGYETTVTENITFSAGETKLLPISLTPGVLEAEQVLISASRRREKVLDAPASVSVIESSQIQDRTAMTPIDHLVGVASVDIVKTGLNQSNVVVRGFNNVFSGALLSLVDNRISRVPSVRLNAYNFIPTSQDDIERIEIVRGPGSALYGPNSANGVLHMITKSPFGSEGTSFSITGGERNVILGSFRHAGSVEDKVGYKFTLNYSEGDDFEYRDPVEEENRINALAQGADPTTLKIARRIFEIERIAAEGRVDFNIADNTSFIVNGGFNRASSIELTGIGAAQAVDWTYSYVQGRLLYKNLFAQAFVNMSDAGDTYVLRDGGAIVDKSKLLVFQVQNSTQFGERQNFTYGYDLLRTRPDTEGTIGGRNEDDDDINEYGLYLQSETNLSDKVKFVAAGRFDNHNWLEDPFFSPRAALVFKPDPVHSFRVTFNRAFSTPTSNNLFLDRNASPASPTQPFNVRVRGVPKTGFTFNRDSNGGLYMQPLWVPDKSNFMPADATLMWSAIVGILLQQGTDISLIPAPASVSVGTVLRVLNSTTREFEQVGSGYVADINRLESTKTNTVELGYKGVLGKKLIVNADIYYSKINDFIGPLRVETPNVFLDPATLGAYLSNFLPPESVSALTAVIAGIPVGTITPNEVWDPADLMLTYRNFGDIDLTGMDLSFTYYMNKNWNLSGSYSYVSKDFFEEEISQEDFSPIALNAPRNKFSSMLHYTNNQTGIDAQLRLRYVDAFPVNSGVFIGKTEAFTLLDFNFGLNVSSVTNARLSVTIQNIFDNKHFEFVGAPEIGRLALARLSYSIR